MIGWGDTLLKGNYLVFNCVSHCLPPHVVLACSIDGINPMTIELALFYRNQQQRAKGSAIIKKNDMSGFLYIRMNLVTIVVGTPPEEQHGPTIQSGPACQPGSGSQPPEEGTVCLPQGC